MVWPVWVILTAFFSVLAFLRHERERAETLAVILIGLFSIQVAKELLQPSAMWVADSLIWIVAAITIVSIREHISAQTTGIAVLLVMSGLCIPIGRFTGEEYALGSVALFFSDVLGASAMFWLGGCVLVGFFRDIASRIFGMGGGSGTSVLGSRVSGGQK